MFDFQSRSGRGFTHVGDHNVTFLELGNITLVNVARRYTRICDRIGAAYERQKIVKAVCACNLGKLDIEGFGGLRVFKIGKRSGKEYSHIVTWDKITIILPFMNWWKVGIALVIVGVLGWIGWYVSRPVPGTKMADQGREHVSPQAVSEFKYNSNPPTSGQHLPSWVKAGVFEGPQSEGELLHALEHGYVIVSYNCNVHLQSQKSKVLPRRQAGESQKVYAHEEEGSSSADFVDPTIATGSAVNESGGCKTLVTQLSELANKKKLWKLIVAPRPQLDTTIALTAWTYVDKFDQFDTGRIERFIDFHRDQGPEKTVE